MRSSTMLRTSLAVCGLAIAVACVDSASVTAPTASAPQVLAAKGPGGPGHEVAACKPQKEEWKTERIGSKGGKVAVGGVELTVPPRALSTTVSITLHKLSTTSASAQFSPEGLHFAVPATLRMDYSHCQTPLLGVKVVYVQGDTITEVEPSNNHPLLKFVAASIEHFSSYAVAY